MIYIYCVLLLAAKYFVLCNQWINSSQSTSVPLRRRHYWASTITACRLFTTSRIGWQRIVMTARYSSRTVLVTLFRRMWRNSWSSCLQTMSTDHSQWTTSIAPSNRTGPTAAFSRFRVDDVKHHITADLNVQFDMLRMRQHLCLYLERQKVLSFPRLCATRSHEGEFRWSLLVLWACCLTCLTFTAIQY